VRYLRDRKRERLEQINAANPEALRKVRDESGNSMARVQAVRALESIGDWMDENAAGRRNQVVPGLVVIIGGPDRKAERIIAPQAPAIPAGSVIDVQPDEFG
jgi:hypothetical protein